jgi:hypothetical protein
VDRERRGLWQTFSLSKLTTPEITLTMFCQPGRGGSQGQFTYWVGLCKTVVFKKPHRSPNTPEEVADKLSE